MKNEMPKIFPGDIVLVSRTLDDRSQWFPALVRKCSEDNANNRSIAFTAFTQDGFAILDGCRWIKDEWWDDAGHREIATSEDVWAWKLAEGDIRLRRQLEELSSVAAKRKVPEPV